MAVFAMLSVGGSPGVTTAALALTLSWPSQVIIAECDPSGGDILAGLLSGHLPAATGLLPLALETGAGAEVAADALWRQLVELDEEHSRLLLAGISDPRQSAALQSSLPWIAQALQGLRADVLADCGRLDALAAVRPVLSAATLAVLVLQPTLRQVSRAVPRVEMLVNLMGPGRVVLLPVGAGAASSRELARTLGVPVVGQLPHDPKTAAVLSDGLGRRRRLDERPLIRSAAAVGRGIRAAAGSAGPLPGFGGPPVYSPYPAGQPDLEGYAPGQPDLEGYAPGQPSPPGLDGYQPDQPGHDRPGPAQPALGRAPTRPGGYGSSPLRPAGEPLAGDPVSGPVPFAASPPFPDDRDSYDNPDDRADREARRPGWDQTDAGWPPLMPYDPGQPEAPGQSRDAGQPYQPGHSRDPGPAPSGEPPWGPRSDTPERPAARYDSRWPGHDRPAGFDPAGFDPTGFDPAGFDPGEPDDPRLGPRRTAAADD